MAQDPWAVVSTQPASPPPQQSSTADPWAVVSHAPAGPSSDYLKNHGYSHYGDTDPQQAIDRYNNRGFGSKVMDKIQDLTVEPFISHTDAAVDAAKSGQYAKATNEGVKAVTPIAMAAIPESLAARPLATLAGIGSGLIASKVGQKAATALGATPDQAELAGNITGLGGGIVGAKIGGAPAVTNAISDALTRTPRSALSKTIKPADPVDFHAAEQSAIPRVQQAALDAGQPVKSAADLLTTVDPKTGVTKLGLIDKAKQNILLEGDNAAGADKNFDELPPDQLAKAKQELTALDTLKKHIADAQETAAKAKPQPTTADSIKQIATGSAKVAAGAAVSPIPVVGKVAGMLGVFKGTPEIVSGVKNLLSKRALTPENLDSAIQQTFSADLWNIEPAARTGSVPADVPAKAPYQPIAGDLTVQHEGTIQPPELPHGDATVSPDRPNPAIVSSGSTAQPLPSRPAAIGPNVKPATSTTQLDSTLPKSAAPTETPAPVKQPLVATTPGGQFAEVLKKAGVQQALKDAGVAAPSATVRQIRPGIDIGPTLQPRMDLTFYGDKTGEGAALMQLTRYNINELRSMAVQRGLDVAPGDSHVTLIDKIHDDLSPAEIKEFNDAAAERSISPRPTQPKRGYQQPAVAQPQAVEEAPQPDRRQNLDLRKAVESMSPEDQVKAIYQDKVTGMPNGRAFDWAENQFGPAKSVAMTDADGLKAFNDKFGHEAGDELLKAKANALKEAGVEAYRTGERGDEFQARGDSDSDLSAKLEKARDILRNTVIRVADSDGKIHEFTGADFSHGTGSDLATAEQNMYKMKVARKASGDAGERGQFGKIKEIE